ncbi:MAG: hypothetical protein GY717_20120 [Rhodobacteraceae bacterium]|nr:hypothetical protein [Paracoccaceae bacterium]
MSSCRSTRAWAGSLYRGRLVDLFAALPETNRVLLNWRRFDNSVLTEFTDETVTARFTMAECGERIIERLTPYKTVFRPSLFDRRSIHRPPRPHLPEEQIRTCNGSNLPLGTFDLKRFRARDPGLRGLVQINHYFVRDAASFVLKSHRGSARLAERCRDIRRHGRSGCTIGRPSGPIAAGIDAGAPGTLPLAGKKPV